MHYNQQPAIDIAEDMCAAIDIAVDMYAAIDIAEDNVHDNKMILVAYITVSHLIFDVWLLYRVSPA